MYMKRCSLAFFGPNPKLRPYDVWRTGTCNLVLKVRLALMSRKKTHSDLDWHLTKDTLNYSTSVKINELKEITQSGDRDE